MRKVAKGRFTLDTKSSRTNHLLVCTVTGIAPFVSYVRTLYQDWKEGKFAGEHKLLLLTGASRSWEFGYHDEMLEYARQVPWLKLVPTVSRPWEDEKWKGETGRVEDILRKYADMWQATRENCVAYLDEKWMGETGRVDDLIRKYSDMWGLTASNSVGYLCGHPEMIEHCKEILKRCGYPKEALKEEIYWVPAKKVAA